jgi:hypothetical protein
MEGPFMPLGVELGDLRYVVLLVLAGVALRFVWLFGRLGLAALMLRRRARRRR